MPTTLTPDQFDEYEVTFQANGAERKMSLKDAINTWASKGLGADAKFREAAEVRAETQGHQAELEELRTLKMDLEGLKAKDVGSFIRVSKHMGLDGNTAQGIWDVLTGITSGDAETEETMKSTTADNPTVGPLRLEDLPREAQDAVLFVRRLQGGKYNPEQVLQLAGEQVEYTAEQRAAAMVADAFKKHPVLAAYKRANPSAGAKLVARVTKDLRGRVEAGQKLGPALTEAVTDMADFVETLVPVGDVQDSSHLGIATLGPSPSSPGSMLHPVQKPEFNPKDATKSGSIADYFDKAMAHARYESQFGEPTDDVTA